VAAVTLAPVCLLQIDAAQQRPSSSTVISKRVEPASPEGIAKTPSSKRF
jgi:hypothetical protein